MEKDFETIEKLKKLAKLLRYYILVSTTKAGSGHPTTCLSAVELMTALFFHEFRFDFANPRNPFNDHLIFSKGHAAPLLYSLYAAAGIISEKDLMNLRKINSPFEGHPTPKFKYVEVATGSLGQGLSAGAGIAIALRTQIQNSEFRIQNLPRVFVLLGDGEMAEGSVWEAIEVSSYYKLANLIGILDVNRLGQSGETMLGHKIEEYQKRISAFGWQTVVTDGHRLNEILKAFKKVSLVKPTMIIAKTIKGKGISFLENKNGWHGKALNEEKLTQALKELGEVDLNLRGFVKSPAKFKIQNPKFKNINKKAKINIPYEKGDLVATREAYGDALVKLGKFYPQLVVLDGDVKNSTYSEKFKEKFPERFFEMFIAEQNMIGVALGLSKQGLIPCASSFAAFLTRAFDQIRMAAVSEANIKLCGSHAGVSIGEDGPSQMGLEDLAMMNSVFGSTVIYPSDAVSCFKLISEMINRRGIVYIRTTREKTPVIYGKDEKFKIGGSKVHENMKTLKHKNKNIITVVAAGITLHEALAAQKTLAQEKIDIRVIDCYSVKPIDGETLRKLARESKAVITVEDHWIHGGLGDAVIQALCEEIYAPVFKLAVTEMPHSGKPRELLEKAGIDRKAIVRKVREINKCC